MNPIGIHALVWVGGWSPGERARAVANTAAAGYDLLEVPILDPTTIDVEATRALLDEAGIGAACSLGLDADTDVMSDDPDVVERGRRRLAGALDVATGLGATHLCGVLHGQLARYTQPASAAERSRALRAVGELAESADGRGITLGLEVVNRYENNLLNTAEQALAFLDDLDAPEHVGVHLDAYHMNIEEDDPAAALRACGDRLAYVHVGESNRGALGSGSVDFPALFATLTGMGYDGPVTFESFSSAVVAPDLSSTLCIWRELWTDGGGLARDARAFVRDGLAAAA